MKRALFLVVLLAFAGCSTGGGGWNPLTAFFGRKAAQEAKVESKVEGLEGAAVDAAQVEVAKTALALDAAPESRPVVVAKRANDNAAVLLNQRKPLSAATLAEIAKIVSGLLSEEITAREIAERAQAKAEASNSGMTQELEKLKQELKVLSKERALESANNLAVANELRWKTIVAWSGTAMSVVLGIAAVAYRLNLGNLQTGVANGLASMQKRYGTDDEDVKQIKTEIDTLVGKGQQRAIFSVLTKRLSS